ncbi:MAG TPA: hypothetical protein VFE33_28865 [Thermoanaerobaculia bacterium]|nr:hypothetical protein [Thermoanaerobaculia bacterium]
MFRKGKRQAAVLTVSALLVASVPALAAGTHTGPRPAAVVEKGYEGLFPRAWQWLQALFADAGACIDPDGKCTSAPAPTVHTDAGGCIDPNGRCTSAATAPTVHTDAGACMDPNGKPCTASPRG